MKEEGSFNYVVDASIIIKWLVHEKENLDFAVNVLNDYLKSRIHISIPVFVHWEINNFLGRALNLETAMEKYSYFKLLRLYEEHLNTSAALKAFAIMKKFHKVSFYDASYHALAIESGGTFLTADKKYYEKTKRIGSVMLLENYK